MKKTKTKINTRKKGNAFQDKVKIWLEKQGYIVHNQKSVGTQIRTKTGKLVWVSKRNDIFGCMDLVAVHPHRKTVFVQATMHTDWKKDNKKILAIPWNLDFCEVYIFQEVVVKKKGKKIKMFRLVDVVNEFVLVGEIERGKFTAVECVNLKIGEADIRVRPPEAHRLIDRMVRVVREKNNDGLD